ncbi:MAG: hypothetical protein FJX45_05060 [Alphaproteobacteria bacterium]|nr:hypothetical protein [Alphaproteobacteria bacterium]
MIMADLAIVRSVYQRKAIVPAAEATGSELAGNIRAARAMSRTRGRGQATIQPNERLAFRVFAVLVAADHAARRIREKTVPAFSQRAPGGEPIIVWSSRQRTAIILLANHKGGRRNSGSAPDKRMATLGRGELICKKLTLSCGVERGVVMFQREESLG